MLYYYYDANISLASRRHSVVSSLYVMIGILALWIGTKGMRALTYKNDKSIVFDHNNK